MALAGKAENAPSQLKKARQDNRQLKKRVAELEAAAEGSVTVPVSKDLAEVASRYGIGVDALLQILSDAAALIVRRPGSWEAQHLAELLAAHGLLDRQ
jgi:hypothetical protein